MSYDGNFYELFVRHLRAAPEAACFETDSGDEMSREWLDQQSGRYANALVSLGCKAGDRVAVQVDKSPQALALYLACVRAGCCFLPLNTAYLPAELEHLLADARPRVFVNRDGNPAGMPKAEAADGLPAVLSFDTDGSGTFGLIASSFAGSFETVARAGDDIAALLYTSGTTGRPKGAILSHRAMSYCAITLGQQWRFTSSDVLLHALPIFHGHGLFISSNVALAAGAKLLFQRKFDANAIIEALPRATVFMGVPTFYHRLLADDRLSPALCRNLRLFISGSAPLSAEVHRDFEARTSHRIIERYGATETMIMCANPMDGERRPGAVGFPLPGVDLRIADKDDRPLPDGEVGMIQVRGSGLFSGYWNMPDQTRQEYTADGYFRTGDLGCVGEGGYISITGRSKDLVISGGYNVYPAEVETAINELASVRESAIVGVPHADFGEAVVAFVIPSDCAHPPTPEDVIQWSRRRLANFKVPKQVFVVDELPRNAMGKVLKNQLRESLASKRVEGSNRPIAA